MARNLKGRDVIFVGAERAYRTEHIARVYGGQPLSTHFITATGIDLAKRLIVSYENYGLATRASQTGSAQAISHEAIAVACCRIINDFQPLEKIVDKSIVDASQQDRDCYLFVALASHCYRQGIEYDLISKRFPNYQVDIQAEDKLAPLPIKIEQDLDVDFVTPLSDSVADTILKRLSIQNPQMVQRSFEAIAHAIRPRVNVTSMMRGEPSCRLASRLFDYDEVVKPLLGSTDAQKFYDSSRSEWAWNSRYWHQIGQMTLDLASMEVNPVVRRELAERAVQHARFAKTIEPNHQFTLTTIGRILFGKIKVLSVVRAIIYLTYRR